MQAQGASVATTTQQQQQQHPHLHQQIGGLSSQVNTMHTHSLNKLPTFLSNHNNAYSVNYQFNMKTFHSQPQQPQIFLSNQQQQQQQQQYQFQKTYQTVLSPQWSNVTTTDCLSSPNSALNPPMGTTTPTQSNSSNVVARIILHENSDDHFNRHIENLNKNEDENTSLICEEQEELNEAKLSKLISKNPHNRQQDQQQKGGDHLAKSNRQEEDTNDEDYFCPPNDEQPKVFQDEDVDLAARDALEATSNLLLNETNDKSLNMTSELVKLDSIKTASSTLG